MMSASRKALPWLALLAATASCSFDHATAPAATVPTSARTSLALGNAFSCGVTTSHTAYCWGRNESGQGGNGTTLASGLPTAVAMSDPISVIAASEASVCALTTHGLARCWGFVPDGQTEFTTRAVPASVVLPTPLASLTVGGAFACGLDKDGHAYCWGANSHGQLGTGDTLPRSAPVPVVDGLRFTQIAAGYAHTCGTIAGGTVYCWGDNTFGESGITVTSKTTRLVEPTPVATTVPMVSVSPGVTFTCAIAQGELGYCWGSNIGGQLGDGTMKSRSTPAPIAGGLHFMALAASRGNEAMFHTCGITTAHVAYCWGANSSGETGGPAETTCISSGIAAVCNTLPVVVRTLGPALAIDAGTAHSCAITTAGTMECWGDNTFGEIGDGTNTNQTKPFSLPKTLRFH